MDLHLILDRRRPLRAQLESKLRARIRGGALRAGTRLPPTRELADELGISRGIVVDAYARLTAEGYLSARSRDGTRVAAGPAGDVNVGARHHPQPGRPRLRYDFRTGLPDGSLFPRRAWSVAAAAATRQLPDAALLYGPPEGLPSLRQSLADYLGRVRAISTEPENVLITCGSGHSMGILWMALYLRGARRVAVEDPCWSQIPESLLQAGLEPVPLAVDAGGLRPDRLSDEIDAVVVSPAHQYPTGSVLAQRSRLELLDWARRSGGLIIEDDYDAEHRYDGQTMVPLQSMAPSHVVYLGSVSKTLAPGMRLGWLIVPDGLLADVVAQQSITHALPSTLGQATYVELLARGQVDRHLRITHRVYRARRAVLVARLQAALTDVRIHGASAGLHLVLWLDPDADERAIQRGASARGVALETLHHDCSAVLPVPPGLILGYGTISESAIPAGVDELAACIAASREASLTGGRPSSHAAA